MVLVWSGRERKTCYVRKGQKKKITQSHTIRPPWPSREFRCSSCRFSSHQAVQRLSELSNTFDAIEGSSTDQERRHRSARMLQPLFPEVEESRGLRARRNLLHLGCVVRCVTHHTSSNQYRRLILQSPAGAGSRIQTASLAWVSE